MLFDLVRVSSAFGRLQRRCQRSSLSLPQRVDDEPSAEFRQPIVQSRSAVAADVERRDFQHGPGVEAGVHLHDGDAGLRVASFDGTVNRRRTAPAWQQACMDVQATQPGHVEHPLRQDQAVGGDHHDVGLSELQGRARSVGVFGIFAVEPQAARLGNGPAAQHRQLLDGGRVKFHAASGRTIGLGQHQRNLESGRGNGIECDTRELRRACKNDAQAAHHGSRSNSRSSPVW